MAVAEDVERVYPTRSELETESQTNIPCPIVGCFKIFRQLSALRFHLVKLHRLILVLFVLLSLLLLFLYCG